MMRLINAELLKVVTTRFLFVLMLIGASLAALATCVTLGQNGAEELLRVSRPGGLAHALQNVAPFGILTFVFGLTALPGEFRHGTLTPTLLATPGRTRLMGAKVVAYTLTAPLILLATLVVAGGITEVWALATSGPAPLFDAEAWQFTARLLLTAVLMCLLGVGIGAILKNQVAAIAGGLVWAMIVEQLLGSLFPRIGAWLPYVSSQLFNLGGDTGSKAFGGAAPEWWVSGMLLATYTGAALLGGALLLRRRDVA